MIEYLLILGAGIGLVIAQEVDDSKRYKKFIEVCEENKRAYERLKTKLDNPKNISKLVSCLTEKN